MRCPSCGNVIRFKILGAYNGDISACESCGAKSVVHYSIPRGAIAAFGFFATYLAVSAIDVDGPTDIAMIGAIVIAGLILLAGALRALVSLKASGNDNKGAEGN